MVDKLREMALFVEVAKAMSFTRASAALGLPNSTLSRRIAALEQAIGVRLFNRTTRSIELTEAGALYYERCRNIVEAARVAHEQLGDLVEKPTGRLRVSTTAELAQLYLAPLAADYARRYPAVVLELDLNPNRVDLIGQNFDLALRIGAQPDSGLISRHLGMVRTMLFASPRYLAVDGRPLRPEDLANHRIIGNMNAPKPGLWTLSRNGVSVDVQVHTPILVNNFDFKQQLARLGLGVTALHEPMAISDLGAGHLQRVLPDWTIREAPVTALMPSRLLPAKTRLFLEMMAALVSPELTGLALGTR